MHACNRELGPACLDAGDQLLIEAPGRQKLRLILQVEQADIAILTETMLVEQHEFEVIRFCLAPHPILTPCGPEGIDDFSGKIMGLTDEAASTYHLRNISRQVFSQSMPNCYGGTDSP